MNIAFTAPMKPLDHPVPSGERTMGRLIVKGLQHAGHEVRIASGFRSWQKTADEAAQRQRCKEALEEADRIAANWTAENYRPDLFLTYHLYHKAPDWIGPALADRFDLPYAIIEASRAPKRQTGPWSFGFAEADRALMRADRVAALHNADAGCLIPVLPPERLTILLPFIEATPFQAAARAPKPSASGPLKLLTVGMMRAGDKSRSYEVLAAALRLVDDLPWRLTVIGDGEARGDILDLLPTERIDWLGALDPEELPDHYARHDLFVWPAIREAFGLVFLEAQAAGLGVIAGDTFGVPDIVKHGETGLLSAEGDAHELARHLRKVLEQPNLAEHFGKAASRHIAKTHTLTAGAERLDRFVTAAAQHKSQAS